MIFVNVPAISPSAEQLVLDCLRGGWISGEGPVVAEFEAAFAQRMQVSHAITTNSGTAALHLAFRSLDIGPGDEVILPASTMGACFFAIWYCGAKAVPVDVLPDTFTIDPAAILPAITAHTKAVLAVHLFGQPCQMDEIVQICRQHHLKLVEDCAEAHGATYRGQVVGSFGDLACYSFYANKIITTGEGGMVTTNSSSLATRIRSLKNFSFAPQKKFIHTELGFRYTMSSLQAALGLAQLRELDQALHYKRQMARYYQRHLAKLPGLSLPVEQPDCQSVYWMYAVRVTPLFGLDRDQVMQELERHYQIQTRSFFYPPQVAFAEWQSFANLKLPIATQLGQDGLYLPSGLGNTLAEFRQVVAAVRDLHHRFGLRTTSNIELPKGKG